MSSKFFYDSDDERDSFDVERRQIENFRRHCLFASSESSEDDDEGIIDGSKVPSSSKVRSRARHSFLDISTLSSASLISMEEENPFDIISKSIDIQTVKKKKKTLGVPKSRIVPDVTDVYEQDETNNEKTKVNRSETTERIRKPTKNDVLETERKMQQLSRSEQLILPKFIPKPLENLQELEKRSRKELLNEIRAKNPSFTPEDSATPEPTSSVASTLADLTKLIEEKPMTKVDKLSRFLNAEILNKKPTMSNVTKQSNAMIDLTETKKSSHPPTMKSHINISSFDTTKSPSSTKKLAEMQKQLGLRMREKRAAMLAENISNIQVHDDDEEIFNDDEKSSESDTETNSVISETLSTMENDQDVLTLDEDAQDFISEEDEDDDELINEEKSNPVPSDPNRPSLKTILTRMESMSESIEPSTTSDTNGQTEWFASSRPAAIDENLELLCSGAFGGDNAIPPSQNFAQPEPLPFSPLPTTQIDDDDDEDFVEKKTIRSKVRQIVDEEAEDEESSEQVNSGSTIEEEEEEEEEEEGEQENEELIDYKKQLFEMEAEESGSDVDEKKPNDDDDDDSDDNDEADEELAKFIDTAAVEMDEDEVDNIAKVHMKMKAKEDEHQLKLLKEQYLDFDGDDDGRRIQITKGRENDDEEEEDDPDYNSEIEEDEEEEEEEDPFNFKDRISELERQRSMQDNQAEELHLDEDLDHIGQHSSMFQKGLALKQKKNQNVVQPVVGESTNSISKNDPKINNKSNGTRSVTLSSVLLAQRFSSTLLAPINKNNLVLPHNSTTGNETNLSNKKQLNPRRHVFAPNENQNPSSSSGEKRANSTEKSPTTKIKRFKQSSTTNNTKSKEPSSSVFSALALSTTRH